MGNFMVHMRIHVGFDVVGGARTVVHFSPLNDANCAGAVLLQDVGEFVRQQPATRLACRRVLAHSENDMAAKGVGPGANLSGGFRSIWTRMYSHMRKIGAKAWLHKASGSR